MRLVKTHGSLNEIFALDALPSSWASDAALRAFVRHVCDRSAWTGGSDGIYLYDASEDRAQAWFFNPDGSSAEFCGNGMRGLGRLILDLRGTGAEVVRSGGRDYTVHRAPSTEEGVRQVLLELPPLRFDDAALPEPFDGFTAVAVPNPHVISVVREYSEPDLIELGKRAEDVFAAGANVSFLRPIDDQEVFVRTFERGAGLTPSCGSGVVASRAAYSRVTGLDPAQRLVVRNAGGVAAASIQVRDGQWYPVLEGNATVVYAAEVNRDGTQAGGIDYAIGENAAYATLNERNAAFLTSLGIETARP
ncbi:MAG TPA: diaminopimelate epimerase [Trebonia sp.]|jgi:diaminopimelate epimerase